MYQCIQFHQSGSRWRNFQSNTLKILQFQQRTLDLCHLLYSASLGAKVRWVLQNQSQITGSLDKAIQQAFPDYKSCRISHWRKQYFKHQWESVPDVLAAKVSQLPNHFRKKASAPLKGPNPVKYTIPANVENQIEEQLNSLIEGDNPAMPRAEFVSGRDLTSSVEWLRRKFNEELKKEAVEVKKRNRDRLSSFVGEEIGAEKLIDDFEEVPQEIKVQDFKHLAKKIKKTYSYTKQSCNTSGNYLSYNDVKMQETLVGEVAEIWHRGSRWHNSNLLHYCSFFCRCA